MNVNLFTSDSEDDSDYQPELDAQTQEEGQTIAPDQDKIKSLWQDLNQPTQPQTIHKSEVSIEEAIDAAKKVKQQQTQQQSEHSNIKVKFAGETLEISKLPAKRPRGSAALDKLVSDVTKKKSINAISKSALDWEKYKEKMSLEDTLSTNRKNGFIDKTKFLTESKIKEAEAIKKLKRRQ